MFHSYLLSSVLTLSITYSWYSLYEFRYFRETRHLSQEQQHRKARVRPDFAVSVYMWDIYNNGVNSSEADIVKGIYPKVSGLTSNSRFYRNHRKRQLEFVIPETQEDETLVKAEVRITRRKVKDKETYFQIYLKAKNWVFLEEKKVSDVDLAWISLHVTPINNIHPGVATFLILTIVPDFGKTSPKQDFFHPVLLLSYSSIPDQDNERTKRSPEPEDYEQKTNTIWEENLFPQGLSTGPKTIKTGCRKKPLYITFSEINYDSWIVAPTGYEVGFNISKAFVPPQGPQAFQCGGKCSFPVGEHLSPTKHAILQTLVHDSYPWKASRPCCVPTRLDPISILYLDDNGVLTYRFRYRDMVVAECGCR